MIIMHTVIQEVRGVVVASCNAVGISTATQKEKDAAKLLTDANKAALQQLIEKSQSGIMTEGPNAQKSMLDILKNQR